MPFTLPFATPALQLNSGLVVTTGSWSLYTLLIVVIMSVLSLILLVAVLIMALSGRFSVAPEEETSLEAPEDDEEETSEEAEEADEAEKTPRAKEWKKPKIVRNGLLHMLVALGLPIAGAAVLLLGENLYGRHVGFTVATGIELMLLVGQIGLAVWAVLIQRKNQM